MKKSVKVTLISGVKKDRTIAVSYETAAKYINNEKAELKNVRDLPKIKDLLESGYKSAYQRKLNEILSKAKARKEKTEE